MTALLLASALVSPAHSPADGYAVVGKAADAKLVIARLGVPDGAAPPAAFTLPDGTVVPAQLEEPAGPAGRSVYVVLPEVKAKQTVVLTPTARPADLPAVTLVAEAGKHVDYVVGGKPLVRYMNAPRDGSSPDAHELTFKPFHHVFDPATGQTLLTNGAGLAADKANLYPHHRGLFLAWNKVTYPGPTGKPTTVDVWHGRANEFVRHDKVLAEETGPVYAAQRSALSWCGKDGQPFASEERMVTVFPQPTGTLISFFSKLTTTLPKVRLDGDPQHAGFHFRAAMEVAQKTKDQTYYVRPDGADKPGATRNWDAKKPDDKLTNVPWTACCFVVGGRKYTVLRMAGPANPGPSRKSERDYGRFGDYVEYDMTPDAPLTLYYRVWVQAGEMTADQCAAMYADLSTGR